MKRKSLLIVCLFMLVVQWLYAQPTITSFSPASGPAGTLVTISGTNLGSPTVFSIGGKAALVISNTGTQLVGYVMPGAATGVISLTTAGGTVNSATNFALTRTPFPSIQKGNPIVSATNYGQAEIGTSVAISGDGKTAIVGGPYYYSGSGINPGVALIYAYSNGAWTQQAEFSASNYSPQQGRSVALSADGNTAMVGGSADDSTNVNLPTGAVWFYTRTGTTWTEQGLPVVGSGSLPYPSQGFSCALSADGNTAIEAGYSDNNQIGAAWVFTRDASGVWTQQGSKLVPADYSGQSYFGYSIALSADGNTAVIGGNNDNISVISNQQYTPGATWVFTRTGSTWAQQGNKLFATGGGTSDRQGTAVGVSADGNTLITGGPGSNSVWIFTRSAGAWSQLGGPFTPTGITGNNGSPTNPETGFGDAVALSADGNTAMVGDNFNGDNDGPDIGGTWIFTRSGNSYVQQGAPLFGTGAGTSQYPFQGGAVALSANGATGITGGAQNGSNYQGGAWVFTAPQIAALSKLTVSSGTLTPGFNTGTVAYTDSVAVTTASIALRAITTDPLATETINGTAVPEGTVSPYMPLNVGLNTITVVVTAQDATTQETYTIVVNRFTSSVATLAKLTVSSGILTPASASGITSYTDNVSNTVASIAVRAITTEPTATETIGGTAVPEGTVSPYMPLTVGVNTILVVVTAPDGVTKETYTITVTRLLPNVATLSNLTVSSGTLTPAFATGTTSYTDNVASTVSTIAIRATTTDPLATETINGTAAPEGTVSPYMTLTVGDNSIPVVVTAENGTTMETYTITVTVAAPPVANSVYEPVSVETTAETPQLADDGILVHQGVSPNGDGIDDFFQIDNITNYPDNKLMIMNRSGALVYEAKGYDNASRVFDGHSNKNGLMQLPGTYFFSLAYAVNGVTKYKTGFIVLKY